MKLRMRPTDDGAKTTLYCATSPEVADDTGLYYEDARRKEPGPSATPELGSELWDHTADWVGQPA
jgi:dehydrogenase/reductase SDR family protein 13